VAQARESGGSPPESPGHPQKISGNVASYAGMEIRIVSAHAPTAVSTSAPLILDKCHFLPRRLHSLSGIVPVGLFVLMHLFTNFQLITGTFNNRHYPYADDWR